MRERDVYNHKEEESRLIEKANSLRNLCKGFQVSDVARIVNPNDDLKVMVRSDSVKIGHFTGENDPLLFATAGGSDNYGKVILSFYTDSKLTFLKNFNYRNMENDPFSTEYTLLHDDNRVKKVKFSIDDFSMKFYWEDMEPGDYELVGYYLTEFEENVRNLLTMENKKEE